MNTKALFGRYWEAKSPIHGLDPRTKLICMAALVAVLFLASNWLSMAFVVACILAMFLAAKIPLSQAFRSIVSILFIAICAALFNVLFVHTGDVLISWGVLQITTGGLNLGAFVGVRFLSLLLLGSLLTMTTTTIDITEATEKLLSPLERIGMPVHEFAFVMGTALRFLPQFADEFHTIRAAQVSRGANLSTSPMKGVEALTSLLVPMFSSVFRHADTLSAAMDARCYQGACHRTRLHPLHFEKNDALAALIVLIIGAITVLLSGL